jgi:hypothetical protein
MATIYLTDVIKSHIRHEIWMKYEKLIVQEREKIYHMNVGREWYEYNVDAKYKDALEILVSAKKVNWVTTQDRVTLYLYTEDMSYHSFISKCSPPAVFPREPKPSANTFEFTVSREMPSYHQIQSSIAFINNTMRTRLAVASHLRQRVFSQCNSVAQLLHIWPGAFELLPTETQNAYSANRPKRITRAKNIQMPEDIKSELIKLNFLI